MDMKTTKVTKADTRIGIIGAGSMGVILARHLVKLGHQVSIANSRGPESLSSLATEAGATPVSVADAATCGEIVILAIPTKAVVELPQWLFANVPESVVIIDIGNYHPELRDGRIDAIDRGMPDSQWARSETRPRRRARSKTPDGPPQHGRPVSDAGFRARSSP
jgi:predicted dinucleotide-binding enzyme